MSRLKLLPASLVLALLAPAALWAQPTFTAVFSPGTIGPGSTSTVIFTIDNGSGSPVTDLGFAATLPAAVTIADPGRPQSSCDLLVGELTAPDGGTTITLSGAGVGAAEICTVSVDVTASTPGSHEMAAVTLSSSAGDSLSSPASLAVVTTLPGFSKSFAPSTVALGGRSTLVFTIDNSANANRIGTVSFTDNLPVGMVVADPANASTDCVSALDDTTLTAVAGSQQVALLAEGINIIAGFEVLPPGASCTVTVDVVSTSSGFLDNAADDLQADFTSAGGANDTLEVTQTSLAITMSFEDDPVPPGSPVDVLFTLINIDSSFSATGVMFSADLTTLSPPLSGLTFDAALENECGGSVSGIGGTSIAFSGGTVAPRASCSIRGRLAVPAATVPGAYAAMTTAITGTRDGSPVVGNSASDVLFVEPVPIITMNFLEAGTLAPDPTINAGDDFVVRYTITNTSSTSAATDITFLDELTDGGPMTGFLPYPIVATLPPVPDPPCGGSMAFAFPDIDRQGLQLTGGSLTAAPGAGATCTFDVTLTAPIDLAPGIYRSTTGAIEATVDGASRVGNVATDTITVIGAPALTKRFVDGPAAPGETVTLEYTLSHRADAPGNATGITFTDDLSATLSDLTANLPPSPDPPCGAGSSLTGSAGDTLLTLSGTSLQPGESCTFSVTLDVPAGAAAGSYPSTTSAVSATVDGLAATSRPATADLQVVGVVLTKEFLDDPVLPGESVTLRYGIENVHPSVGADIVSFADDLNAALSGLAATGGALVDTCGGTLSGTNSLTYTGGSVASGSSCSIDVLVQVPAGAADGTYNSTTSFLQVNQGGVVVVNPATDQLVVNSSLLQVTKQFTDDPVAPGDVVTMEYTISNLDPSRPATDIAFQDPLGAALSGLQVTHVILPNGCAALGFGFAGLNSPTLSVFDGSLAAGESCTVRFGLPVPAGTAAGTYASTTTAITGTIDGFPVSGEAATDNLDVRGELLFSKAFDGPTTATGTAVLTFNISNPGTDTATGLSFSDDLDAVLAGLVATSLDLDVPPCGAGSELGGTSFLTLTGGELPPMGGTCSFRVEVQVPAGTAAGTYTNTTSELFQSGLTVAEPATADLVIEPAPVFSKTFTPDTVAQFEASTLRFSIDNTASALAATALDVTDNLPAGMTVATPPNSATTCTGGTLTAADGSSVVAYSGGSVAAGSTCTIEVDVVASSVGVLVNTTGELTSSSGNSGNASDTLTVMDAEPPVVTSISTGEGPLAACTNLREPVASIQVVMEDGGGAIFGADDPANYKLIATGPNGEFDTQGCGATQGDDEEITVLAVETSGVFPSVEVDASVSAEWLPVGLYRFFVCDSITDGSGNALDGDFDGLAGGDALVPVFRADPWNLFDNAHFDDCPVARAVTLAPWAAMATAPNAVLPGTPGIDDASGSPLSASALVVNTAGGASALSQCVEVEGGASYELRAALRYTSASLGALEQVCDFYDDAACAGALLGTSSLTSLLEDGAGSFAAVSTGITVPAGASSGLCAFAIESLDGGDASLELALDRVFMGAEFTIFTDGFETGDTTKWSAVLP